MTAFWCALTPKKHVHVTFEPSASSVKVGKVAEGTVVDEEVGA